MKYVLVHGAWNGNWCWGKIVSLLKSQGHDVEALNLPGHADSDVALKDITLQTYVDRVCQVLDRYSEPVVLVGHSMGGAVITQTAELRPKQVKSLVYVTGFLLRKGEAVEDIADADTSSLVSKKMVPFPEEGYGVLQEEFVKDALFGKCSEHDAEKAKSRLVKQPLAPLGTPVKTTDQNFGSVQRYYIECLQDRAITNEFQKMMYTNSPCEKVFTLDTDHSPFYSNPEKLSSILLSVDLRKCFGRL